MGNCIILLMPLNAQTTSIYIPSLCPRTVGEEVFCSVWCQRGAEMFSGGLEGAAATGPPSISSAYSFSTR